jgi:hypothetical protein
MDDSRRERNDWILVAEENTRALHTGSQRSTAKEDRGHRSACLDVDLVYSASVGQHFASLGIIYIGFPTIRPRQTSHITSDREQTYPRGLLFIIGFYSLDGYRNETQRQYLWVFPR